MPLWKPSILHSCSSPFMKKRAIACEAGIGGALSVRFTAFRLAFRIGALPAYLLLEPLAPESGGVVEPVAPGVEPAAPDVEPDAAGSLELGEVADPLASGDVDGEALGLAASGVVDGEVDDAAPESEEPVPDILEPDALEPPAAPPLAEDASEPPPACSSPLLLQPVAATPKSATRSAAFDNCAIAFMIFLSDKLKLSYALTVDSADGFLTFLHERPERKRRFCASCWKDSAMHGFQIEFHAPPCYQPVFH
jgi:hypothetical protein